MINPTIHLGFEVGTGNPVAIPLRHTGVTGQTQQSGKTTTLEGLITRSGLRAVAFVTKRGESSFHVMRNIDPYFRERTDWQFVQSILEATMSERLKFQRAWIMRLCRSEHTKKESWDAPKTLADVQRNVGTALQTARGINQSVYTELDEYLSMVIPQIERLPYSSRLELQAGVNVMDLTPYDFPLQALVVRSAIEWIHGQEHNTITVIPEAWKFTPKQRNTPVRLAAEELIREGGALKNFIWIDSQDLAGVADVLVRQIGVWILGVQRAKHEIERTLDNIPDDIHPRPRKSDIMRLERGQFIACWEGSMFKVYVQPAWMTEAHAQAIARGEEDVDSAKDILREYEDKDADAGIGAGTISTDSTSRNQSLDRSGNRSTDKYSRGVESNGEGTVSVGHVDQQRGAIAEKRESEIDAMNIKALAEALRLPEGSTENDILNSVRNLVASFDSVTDEYKKLRRSSAAGAGARNSPKCPDDAPVSAAESDGLLSPGTLEQVWQYVRNRANADPAVLQLLQACPELRIVRKVQTISMDASNLRGSLAILISEKFFDKEIEFAPVRVELIRRGFLGSKAPNLQISQALQGLVELGFLTKEANGYQVVPKMKVHVVEQGGGPWKSQPESERS